MYTPPSYEELYNFLDKLFDEVGINNKEEAFSLLNKRSKSYNQMVEEGVCDVSPESLLLNEFKYLLTLKKKQEWLYQYFDTVKRYLSKLDVLNDITKECERRLDECDDERRSKNGISIS